MPSTTPPNILFVYMDDMGYGDMGCFGATAVRTPVMDRIAAEGMRLTACYATNAMCSPSRASLLTGRYAGRSLIPRVLFPRDHIGLDPDQHQTFGAALQDQGYTTGCFGKWHVGCTPRSHPCRNGFDRFLGLPYSNDMDPLPLFDDERCIEEDPDQAWLTRRYCDAAMDFIDQAGDRPWFAYIAHTMPHIPLHVEPG
ncbi:MAG: sulfatase-like hydrolase/transferase, partial [Planctomycetota bacterium]